MAASPAPFCYARRDASHAKEAKMSDPPPDQHTSRNGSDNPSAEQIERMTSAFEAYARSEETAGAGQTKLNRKIRRLDARRDCRGDKPIR